MFFFAVGKGQSRHNCLPAVHNDKQAKSQDQETVSEGVSDEEARENIDFVKDEFLKCRIFDAAPRLVESLLNDPHCEKCDYELNDAPESDFHEVVGVLARRIEHIRAVSDAYKNTQHRAHRQEHKHQ
jgi:hypothetical protein